MVRVLLGILGLPPVGLRTRRFLLRPIPWSLRTLVHRRVGPKRGFPLEVLHKLFQQEVSAGYTFHKVPKETSCFPVSTTEEAHDLTVIGLQTVPNPSNLRANPGETLEDFPTGIPNVLRQ